MAAVNNVDVKQKAIYICFEGSEGCGKTTQTARLVSYLRDKGYKVLDTKEPGTLHLPVTMELRKIMLDKQYDVALTETPIARELISQSIRAIHMEQLILPSLYEYDFIIQDRGTLSGFAYGTACGMSIITLMKLSSMISKDKYEVFKVYDNVIYLRGDVNKGLEAARTSKQEFKDGDAIEAKGEQFMKQVRTNMDNMSYNYPTITIDVNSKSKDEVFNEILKVLGL